MRKLLWVALSLAVLCAGLVFLIGRREPSLSSPARTADIEAHAADRIESTPIESIPQQTPRESQEPSKSAPPSTASPHPGPTKDRAEIRGRFLLPAGAPATGVAVAVQGWAGNQVRTLKFGTPDHWEDPSTMSAADGRFSISLDPPRAFLFTVAARLDGYCKESWRWNEIQPGETKDLGDVVLKRGGTITGKIIDAAGLALHQEWIVYADGADTETKDDKEPVREHAAIDRDTGEFRIEGLSSGSVKLKAYLRMAGWAEGPTVEVRAGEVAQADVRYTGPDIGSMITVLVFSQPFHTFGQDTQEIVLRGSGIEARKASRDEHSSQSYSFTDLPPGRYTVEIHDPMFLPWSQDGVEPGTSVNAKLKGSAGIRLSVLDSNDGSPVVHYTARVRFDKSNWRPNVFPLLEASRDPPADGLFDGLIPTDQTLIVGADGFADCLVEIANLQPNEIRSVTARMSHGATLSGIVVQGGARKPLPRVDVFLLPPVPLDSQVRILPSRDDPSVNSVKTDEGGHFSFPSLPAATYDLVAEWNARFRAEIDDIKLDASKSVDDIVIALGDAASLHGRVIGPEAARFDGLWILASPARKQDSAAADVGMQYASWTPRDKMLVPLEPDGSYRIDPVAAGDVQVSLLLPDVRLPSGFTGWSSSGGPVIDLGTLTVPADADVEHDFDLRSTFPGWVRLSATLSGQPAVGVVVEIQGSDEFIPIASSAVLDDHGTAHLGPIPVGEYRVVLHPVDSSWFYFAPAQLEIAAGSERELSVDVPLVAGDLQFVQSETGEPLVSTQLLIRLEGNPRSPAVVTETDSKGVAHLRIPPARYVISLVHDSSEPGGFSFDWTDKGPVPPVIKLK